MEITYKDRYDYARNANILAGVKITMAKKAIDIQAEDSTTANHAARSSFAITVLRDPEHWGAIMAIGVATQLTTPEPSDTALNTVMASIWNAYAVTYTAPVEV